MVNHNILLQKLDIAHTWFTSYLSNRKQYVLYNNDQSDYNNIQCGVPHGSIIGPILFLLYVNNTANSSDVLFSILFADDSNVFINGSIL